MRDDVSQASQTSAGLPANAVVMRRVPRRPDHTQPIHGTDRHRATSYAIRAKEDELGSSVSWIHLTTPIQCVEVGAATSGYQVKDFQIAIIRKSDPGEGPSNG